MRSRFCLAAALVAAAVPTFAVGAQLEPVTRPAMAAPARWSPGDLDALLQEIDRSAREGLHAERYGAAELRQAIARGVPDLDARADRSALLLAHDYAAGSAPASARKGWGIGPDPVDLGPWLQDALGRHDVAGALQHLLPQAPGYAALRAALPACDTPAHCATISLNLERWRWLPRSLGYHYLWVNTAAYQLDLVENDRVIESHRVIVGKPASPTPVFAALVTGVTANPWWNVPRNIVAESVGATVRNRPAEAARLGYVATRGAGGLQVRQRPGPLNALGQVKLELPNPYSVFIHDTPSRALFDKEVRAFSHGCIRTQDPVRLARTLLGAEGVRSFDQYLAAGTNRTIALDKPVPVYIVYFTAVANPAAPGGVDYFDDVYRRDPPLAAAGGF
jgi:murein L,D-transpeptidase YcbB/YkuD